MTAKLDGVALLRAIRGVVAGELGTTRRVVDADGQPLCTYAPGLLEQVREGLPIEETAFFEAGHWFSIVVPGYDVHDSTTGVMGSRSIDVMPVAIELLSSCGNDADGEDVEIELQGSIINAGVAIVDALSWPPNLRMDDRGKATGLVDGLCGVGRQSKPGFVLGVRDCHLQRWVVNAVAIPDRQQEV